MSLSLGCHRPPAALRSGDLRNRRRDTAHRVMCNQQGTKGGFRVLERTGALVPQGLLVKTAKYGWRTAWKTLMTELAPQSKDGTYQRPTYNFQGTIGSPDFPFEAGRYHLYVGNACPWCHRVLLALVVAGLQGTISFSRAVDDPERASRGGWVFDGKDPVFGCSDLREVYDIISPGFKGRCTAPLLIDAKAKKAVCNESSIIVRNLANLALPLGQPAAAAASGGASAGASVGAVDLCPAELLGDIERWNTKIYETVNNGVYQCGFSTTQAGFSKAEAALFDTLQELDGVLSRQRFVCGERFTEADLRLFPTIVRFDAVYATLFKCCRRRVADHPHLQAWLRDVHQLQLPSSGLQLRDCFDLEDARRSYFQQLFPLNPSGIVPGGPTAADLGLDVAAGRGSVALADVFHFKLLDTWIAAARRHGVPQHKVVPWVRRKLGTAVVVLRFRGDGRLGCSVPCVLCQRELQRFDLQVTCYLGDLAASGEPQWFSGRLSDVGAPSPVLTAGQRRTLNLEPMPGGVSARAVIAEPLPPAIKGGGGGGKKKSKSRKKRAPR
ncbi:Glutathionyl-hydroquinone reductase PcpF [Chlorella vulgaris]